jgi:Mg-chelatase subunit ChlD/tetratricopeptide (TPR) repeat protein
MKYPRTKTFRGLTLALAIASLSPMALGTLLTGCSNRKSGAFATTVGDLRTMHADVEVRGREIRGQVRLLQGDQVKTGATGRARVRLDDGTQIVVDAETKFDIEGSKLRLWSGRLFVQAGASARTEVAFAGATTTVVSSAAAFEASAETTGKVYCARGELVLQGGGTSAHVPSGETAKLAQGSVKVAPETAFDDWTSGLATPWSGERGPKSAIPELWAGPGGFDPGAPMVVRSETVQVSVEGELAITKTKTSYFNGSDQPAQADVRLALPTGALVFRVARSDEGSSAPSEALVAQASTGSKATNRLEWAGDGWLRGTLVDVAPGKSMDLVIEYAEWLNQQDGLARYRFPMASASASDREAPMVGGLSVTLDTKGTRILSASGGGVVPREGGLELRRADTRPTGDFVAELMPDVVRSAEARAYVTAGEGKEDPYVLIRTEVPQTTESGITLAVVLDSSMSVGPSLLETERVVVSALLDAMGPKDSVVVLAADQNTRSVGGAKPMPVTVETRAVIKKALSEVRAGGASNLGLALEQAADLLDQQEQGRAGAGMVVYVGDGRPTVGEASAREIRKRLARRASGVPRLSTVAMGQGADRALLAELAQGTGPIYEALDRQEAARAGGALVADALTPSIRGVSLELGATIDRIYPREPRTVPAGATTVVTGRLRTKLPSTVTLRYRKGTELVEEQRPLVVVPLPANAGADIMKRWAAARVEEISMRGEGLEGAMALAAKAQLLTPWTGFYWGTGVASPWGDRMLGFNPETDVAFTARIAPAPPPPSLVLEPPPSFTGEDTLENAIEIAAHHTLMDALAALVACRDARSMTNPNVDSQLSVSVRVDVGGHATSVNVVSSGGRGHDGVLERCSRGVISAIPFLASGVAISFTHTIALPAVESSQRTACSATSTVPLAVKRGIWRARNATKSLDYRIAQHQCELPTWNDRRTLLSLLIAYETIANATALAAHLAATGDSDAASFVRQELLRRPDVSSMQFDELRQLFVGDEPRIDGVLNKAYRVAKADPDRLKVVQRFLRVAPHSPLGRRLLLALLEKTGQKAALSDAVFQIRTDPFADAGLLAAGASALLRLGEAQEDPWTLGYVGDRLRSEGLYEDALAAYQRLDLASPDDPGVALRLALAQAGAGRLDIAIRLLDRAGQTGGRGDDGRTGELSSIVSASLLAGALQALPAPSPETAALLQRRLAETSLPDVSSLILVRTPLGDDPVEVQIARQETDKDELPADLDATSMGLSAIRIERGGGTARIHLRRRLALPGSRLTHAIVSALIIGTDRSKITQVTREVDVDEKGIELRWNGETLR